MVEPIPEDVDKQPRSRDLPVAYVCNPCDQMPKHSLHSPRTRTTQHLPLLPPSRGSLTRHPFQLSVSSGSQKERPLAKRCPPQAVWKGSKGAVRIEKGGAPSSPLRTRNRFKPRSRVQRRRLHSAARSTAGADKEDQENEAKGNAASSSRTQPLTATTIAALKAAFTAALRKARRRKHHIFLDLYAGTGGVSWSVSKKGYASLAFDISLGSHFDFRMPCIHKFIKAGSLLAVLVGS